MEVEGIKKRLLNDSRFVKLIGEIIHEEVEIERAERWREQQQALNAMTSSILSSPVFKWFDEENPPNHGKVWTSLNSAELQDHFRKFIASQMRHFGRSRSSIEHKLEDFLRAQRGAMPR